MSVILQRYINLIKVISSIKDPNVRKSVLEKVKRDKQFYSALREIIRNTVSGTLKLTKVQKKKLQKHKRTLKSIFRCRTCSKKRCKLIKQSGGFLPILLPTIASLLGSIILK